MSKQSDLTPVENELRRKARRFWVIVLLLVVAVGLYFYWAFNPNRPVEYSSIEDHFKYGSIGSEPVNGLPYWIFKALPVLFADKLPGQGYASLGFIEEPGRDTPIGFSKRRVFIDRVWLNCGVCHTGTVRDAPQGQPTIYLGMPANTMDLEALVRFLIACGEDHRFTSDRFMGAIARAGGNLNFIERLIYRYVAIPQTREAFLRLKNQLRFLARQPSEWGPGRVDTFNPYKVIQFNFPMDKLPDAEIIGTSDLPSIWLQKLRAEKDMDLHWDGNNKSVEERNKSAALGAGVTPTTIDLDAIKRIQDWFWDQAQPPGYPYEIDKALAAQGQAIYDQQCAACHGKTGRDFSGQYVGRVVPIDDPQLRTDPSRLDSFTYDLVSNQNTLYAGYPWRFTHFRKTNGYTNMPLDGLWLRAPYLHNGSVPTLRDLLEPPENRPKEFYRGCDVYDKVKVGFVSNVPEENGRRYFKYDTTLKGNYNAGHLYGTTLTPKEKDALVEYLKTF
jgi:hypothetical protein